MRSHEAPEFRHVHWRMKGYWKIKITLDVTEARAVHILKKDFQVYAGKTKYQIVVAVQLHDLDLWCN